MLKWLLFGLLFTISCSSSEEHSHHTNYSNCSIIIACPNIISYYLIEFNQIGEGTLGFCFKKYDTINYAVGKNDSITKSITFHLSKNDKKYIDSLLANIQPNGYSNKGMSHDSFKYTLKLDDVVKSEQDASVTDLHKILETIARYFPKDFASYDFYGFFEAYNVIK
jgi:hypothetical protein